MLILKGLPHQYPENEERTIDIARNLNKKS
jgi:hypothetical protein